MCLKVNSDEKHCTESSVVHNLKHIATSQAHAQHRTARSSQGIVCKGLLCYVTIIIIIIIIIIIAWMFKVSDSDSVLSATQYKLSQSYRM